MYVMCIIVTYKKAFMFYLKLLARIILTCLLPKPYTNNVSFVIFLFVLKY
jgi:hypothetical protein